MRSVRSGQAEIGSAAGVLLSLRQAGVLALRRSTEPNDGPDLTRQLTLFVPAA